MDYKHARIFTLKVNFLNKEKLWFLISALPLIPGVYWLVNMEKYKSYGLLAFQYWNILSIEDILSTTIIYCYLLFIMPYLIERVFLKHAFSLDEKIVFYPVIGMMVLGFLGFLLPPIAETWALKFLLPFLLSLLLLFVFKFKGKNNHTSVLHLNPFEIFGLILITAFRIFIYYSALGDDLFIKQDMVYQAGYIGRINRYGLIGYLSSPLTEHYPAFYFCAWSSISKLIPLPYINILVLASFVNHVLATLSFYVLAKKLLGDYTKALFSTFALIVLSGFSWLYILREPLTQQLSAEGLYNYIRRIHNKFGMYSGSTVSTIYADIHSLVRLWSLNVYFSSLYALLTLHFNSKNKEGYLGYLFVFSAGFIQIALGHPPELVLIGLSLFTFAIMSGKEIFKDIFKWILPLTILSLPLMLVLSCSTECIIALFFPLVLFLLALPLQKLLKILVKKAEKPLFNLLSFIIMPLTVWYYGAAIISFVNNYDAVNISYPIFTLWYSPPIQLGFLGLLFIVVIIKIAFIDKKVDFGLLFSLLMLSLLALFMLSLNCINLYLYVGLPYPFIPIYFFPFLALSSSYLLERKENKSNILKKILVVSFLVSIFVFGSLCHVISASYWRGNDWWSEKPASTSLSTEETQILNLLYATSPRQSYEEICFIPKSQPYPNVEGSAYQQIRYRATSEEYLIRLSGFTPSSRLAESGLFDAKDIKEVSFIIENFSPIRFILVEKGTESFIPQLMEGKVIFRGNNYQLYELSSSSKKILEGVLVEKISFEGNLSTSQGDIFKNVNGNLIPLNESCIMIYTQTVGNITAHLPLSLNFEGKITFFNVKATRLYFSNALCVGQKITFQGNLSTIIMASFDDARLYLTSLKPTGVYSIYPEPWHMNPEVATKYIHAYIRINEIPLLHALRSPAVITWTIAIVLIAIAKFKLNKKP
ncbi:MAG: hypothetical protein QXF43_05395 [Nitrososphaerales archaeon]